MAWADDVKEDEEGTEDGIGLEDIDVEEGLGDNDDEDQLVIKGEDDIPKVHTRVNVISLS